MDALYARATIFRSKLPATVGVPVMCAVYAVLGCAIVSLTQMLMPSGIFWKPRKAMLSITIVIPPSLIDSGSKSVRQRSTGVPTVNSGITAGLY